VADETVGLRLNVEGQQGFADAARRAEDLEREFAQLQSVIERGAPGWELARKNIDGVKRALEDAKRAADSAFSSMSKTPPIVAGAGAAGGAAAGAAGAAGVVAARGGGGMQGFGNTVLYASQAIEDLQYGFRAVLNNIPLLVMAMGGGAGLAGALSLAGIAVSQLTQRLGSMAGATTTVDQDLAAAQEKARAERVKQIATEDSPAINEQRAAIREALKGAGGARGMVEQIVGKEGIRLTPDEMAERVWRRDLAWQGRQSGNVHGAGGESEQRAAIARMEARARSRRERELMDLEARAETDPQSAAELAFIVSASGLGGTGKRLLAASGPKPVTGLTEAMIGGTKGMTDEAAFRTLIGEQERLTRQYEAGTISAKVYEEESAKVTAAMDAQSAKAAQASEETLKAAEAEAKLTASRQEGRRKVAQDEATSTEERLMSGQGFAAIKNAFGGNIVQAMLAAGRKGQDDGTVDSRLQTQLEGQLTHIPPSLRGIFARRLIEQARQMQQEISVQNAVGADVGHAMMAANMAPANTALGRMQRQVMARQMQFGGQFGNRAAAMAAQLGNAPEVKQMGAADKQLAAAEEFRKAVDDLRNGGIVL
jgi:hypothetical protein